MDVDDFREMALSFQGAEEGSHMGSVDFRVGNRIFATLAMQQLGYGNLMLNPELQKQLIDQAPDVFLPVHGGWGRNGATHIRLSSASESQLKEALQMSWKLRVEKNNASRSGKRIVKKQTKKKPG